VHGLGLNRKQKGEKEDDRWGRDVIEKDKGKERLVAGTRGDAEGGRRVYRNAETWDLVSWDEAACRAATRS
jgi:hypothetical protein